MINLDKLLTRRRYSALQASSFNIQYLSKADLVSLLIYHIYLNPTGDVCGFTTQTTRVSFAVPTSDLMSVKIYPMVSIMARLNEASFCEWLRACRIWRSNVSFYI